MSALLRTLPAAEPALMQARRWDEPTGARTDLAHLLASASELPALAATLTSAGRPRVHVSVTGPAIPDANLVGILREAGVESLRLVPALGASKSWHWAQLLCLAREMFSHGLGLTWGAPPSTHWPVALEVGSVVHLPAPVARGGADRSVEWAARHAHGLCLWRQGPGFVLIYDEREAAAQTVIDDSDLQRLFHALHAPVRLGELTAADRERVGELVEADFVLLLDDVAVTLPYRLRHWPVPNTSY